MRVLLPLLCLACEPVEAVITPLRPDGTPDLAVGVDVRLATELDGEAVVLDVDEEGAAVLVARQAVRASKSHVAIDPTGQWWAFCDRAADFGVATLRAGPIGAAVDLGLPPDCHHPTLSETGLVSWGRFGNGSVVLQHDLAGVEQPGSLESSAGTLWHPRVDPTGRWVTAVVSSGSDVGPILVVDLHPDGSREVWSVVEESRGGWRDVADGVLVAAHGFDLSLTDLEARRTEVWSLFPPEIPCTRGRERPCGLAVRDPRWFPDGRVALIGAPTLRGDDGPDWELFVALGPGEVVRLTDDDHRYGEPVWGRSGEWVYAQRDMDTIVRVPADGSGPPEVVIEGALTGWGGLDAARP